MIFKIRKDGGKESTVTGYWLCEFKSLFSVVLLKFEGKSREAFHTHAFNSWNWILKGRVKETKRFTRRTNLVIYHNPSIKPIYTSRKCFHKVDSDGTTWVFALRGPWKDTWKEHVNNKEITLTHGRQQL